MRPPITNWPESDPVDAHVLPPSIEYWYLSTVAPPLSPGVNVTARAPGWETTEVMVGALAGTAGTGPKVARAVDAGPAPTQPFG